MSFSKSVRSTLVKTTVCGTLIGAAAFGAGGAGIAAVTNGPVGEVAVITAISGAVAGTSAGAAVGVSKSLLDGFGNAF